MKRKKKYNIILGISAITIISLVLIVFYSAEQTRIRGFNFGNDLQRIQEELKQIQTEFQTEITIWEEGDISTTKLLDYLPLHVSKMEELLLRYDSLDPPESFKSSVDLFKLSTQSQLNSDKELIIWIETGNEEAKLRSDLLIKESFEYELAALAKYNAAKAGIDQ